MINPNDATEVVPYLTSAATIVAIQKWLKTRGAYAQFVTAFPLADKYVHWLVAGTGSLVAATGIHMVWNWDLIHAGTFSGTIPSVLDMLHGLGDWFKVYILQHTVYEATHQPPYQPAVKDPPLVPAQATLRAGQPDPLQPLDK